MNSSHQRENVFIAPWLQRRARFCTWFMAAINHRSPYSLHSQIFLMLKSTRIMHDTKPVCWQLFPNHWAASHVSVVDQIYNVFPLLLCLCLATHDIRIFCNFYNFTVVQQSNIVFHLMCCWLVIDGETSRWQLSLSRFHDPNIRAVHPCLYSACCSKKPTNVI